MPDAPLQIEGLRETQRALRRLEPDLRKQFREDAFKRVALVVAREAAVLAPKRTGRLAGSLRGTTSGFKAVVRSPLPYANVIHWGGTTGRGHSRSRPGATRIKRTEFVLRAAEQKREVIEDAFIDGVHEVARRNGWA